MENWYESLDNDIKLELDESLETVDKERDRGAKITYVFYLVAGLLLAASYGQSNIILALIAISLLLMRVCESINIYKTNQAASQVIIVSQLRQLERVK